MREPRAPSLDELLRELEAISPPAPGGKTMREWQAVWKIGEPRARAIVHHAITVGRMKTTPAYRPDIARPGRRVQVWLHRFVEKKRGKP
jgi:hypothetical protein